MGKHCSVSLTACKEPGPSETAVHSTALCSRRFTAHALHMLIQKSSTPMQMHAQGEGPRWAINTTHTLRGMGLGECTFRLLPRSPKVGGVPAHQHPSSCLPLRTPESNNLLATRRRSCSHTLRGHYNLTKAVNDSGPAPRQLHASFNTTHNNKCVRLLAAKKRLLQLTGCYEGVCPSLGGGQAPPQWLFRPPLPGPGCGGG